MKRILFSLIIFLTLCSQLKANTYTYDYENRLIKITYPDGTSSEYKYNGVGKKIESKENGVITKYLYDGLNAIIERDVSDTTIATYIRGLSYGGGIGSIISVLRNQSILYYHYDGLGTVTGLSDPQGSLVQAYQYDAYGNLLATTGQIVNPYQFSTKEFSPQSNLIYFGARYYDSKIGRFITKDPFTWGPDDPRGYPAQRCNLTMFIPTVVLLYQGVLSSELLVGIVEDGGEFTRARLLHIGALGPQLLHRYAYVGQNPVNFIDPWGLAVPWWKWLLNHLYIDIGVSFSATGVLGPGVNLGLKITPDGLYGYYGFGLGIGAGVSATINLGTPPSEGVSINATVRGGAGWGGQGSLSYSRTGFGGGIGAGFGIGFGTTVTTSSTHKLIGW